jgi:hypothetical protein
VTWRVGASLVHGVSGPITSGCAVPATTCSIPGLCHEKFGLRAWATLGPGHMSVKCARPPLPAARCTDRVVERASAANATPLPAVLSRIS